MSQQLERDVRFLKRYSIVMTAMLLVVSVGAFVRPPRHEKFGEIDVERINVVEPDGKYRLIISNTPRSIGPIYKRKPFGYEGGNRPGLIFFNDEGTENGGFTFGGKRLPNGQVDAQTHMSFDQFNQDQVLNLDYSERRGQRNVGVSIYDRTDADILDLVKERDANHDDEGHRGAERRADEVGGAAERRPDGCAARVHRSRPGEVRDREPPRSRRQAAPPHARRLPRLGRASSFSTKPAR